jgi:hypothetical protein
MAMISQFMGGLSVMIMGAFVWVKQVLRCAMDETVLRRG